MRDQRTGWGWQASYPACCAQPACAAACLPVSPALQVADHGPSAVGAHPPVTNQGSWNGDAVWNVGSNVPLGICIKSQYFYSVFHETHTRSFVVWVFVVVGFFFFNKDNWYFWKNQARLFFLFKMKAVYFRLITEKEQDRALSTQLILPSRAHCEKRVIGTYETEVMD